jgi:signal transduction histidine kinase/ligand-binding sensor domain-containing protein
MSLTTRSLRLIAVLTVSCMAAICPAREIQYPVRDIHHTSWTSERGVGAVFDIQQDRSGYLWLTTANGIVSFDGVNFRSLEEVTGDAIHSYDISSVLLARSGRTWFTTRAAGLILLEGGKRLDYPFNPRCVSRISNGAMVEDVDGSLWVRAISGLYHLEDHSCKQIEYDLGYPGGIPAALLVDKSGTVWVKAPSGALLFRPRGQPHFELSDYVSGPTTKQAFLHQGPDGAIWLSDECGLRKLVFGKHGAGFRGQAPKPKSLDLQTGDFGFAPDGSLWAVVGRGISRFDLRQWISSEAIDAGAGETITTHEGLSSNAIWSLKVDTEGSVWVGTNAGLDRLRVTAVKSIEVPNAQEHEFALAAGAQGSIWTGNASLPLMRVNASGRASIVDKTHDVTCIRRDHNGTIWSVDDGPVKLWRSSPKGFEPVHYPEENVAGIVSLAVDRNNEPWINLRFGPTYHLTNGKWRDEYMALGKKVGLLGAMVGDDTGIVWLSFWNSLVRWDGKSYQKFSFPPGRLDISVATMAAREGRVWIAGAGGIVMFTRGQFYLMEFVDPHLPGRVSGIVETEKGELWANGFSGITHVSAAELARWVQNPTSKVTGEHLDAFDGLPGLSAERFPEPSIVEASDGRMWFATTRGVAWLHPAVLSRLHNRVPPPVFVTSVIADGKTYSSLSDVRLPKLTQNLAITYTALSLAVSERVRFRYKLEGVDRDWQEAGPRREAFYTKLSPGRYTFSVVACNNDGVWNLSGASIQFTIPPAFYQTMWLKWVAALFCACLFWLLIKLRMRWLSLRIQERWAARASERERIARELHDSFLQGIQGLLLRFNTAARSIPADTPARKAMDNALAQSAEIMLTGRRLVQDLRNTAGAVTLSEELEAVGREFQGLYAANFSVNTWGKKLPLNPEVADELFKVGREAISNAFHHAQAKTIHVEMEYRNRDLKLSIRDNGVGIDQQLLIAGKKVGHWGLPGMRERIAQLNGNIRFESWQGMGTTVEVRIPAHRAYKRRQFRLPHWLSLTGDHDRYLE